MSLEIRTATPDELRDAIDVVSTAFLDRPDLARLAASVRETGGLRRAWMALDGARTRGGWGAGWAGAGTWGVGRAWATGRTSRAGAPLPAAAVGPVTVLPTHRRRGAFKDMTA